MALFDFESFINELRDNDKKKEVVTSYESYYGTIDPDLRKQVWYVNYVKALEDLYPEEGILVPDDLEDDFDWRAMFALIAGSFSSKFRFEKDNDNPSGPFRLWIKVSVKRDKSEEVTTIEKSLDELWSFQILRLFELYIEEQINLQKVQAEEPDSEDIHKERKDHLATLKKALKQVRGQDEDDVIVYHYTSLKSFSDILKSEVLRATNTRLLKERSDVGRWFGVFEKAFDEVRAKIKQSDDAGNNLAYLDLIGKQVNKTRDLETYFFSASRCPDDERLFDSYGDDGKGVCIGFKEVTLSDRAFANNKITKEKPRVVVEGLLYGYVEYDESILVDEVKQIIEEILEDCKAANKSPEEFFDSVSLSERFYEKCVRIYMRCQDAKDAKYSDEKEYCLYWQHKKDNPLKPVELSFEGGRILPYVNIDLGKSKLPITEIIVGPRCDDSVANNIKDVMAALGYNDVTVKKSEIRPRGSYK